MLRLRHLRPARKFVERVGGGAENIFAACRPCQAKS